MGVQLNPRTAVRRPPNEVVARPSDRKPPNIAKTLSVVGQIRGTLEKMFGRRFAQVPKYFEPRLQAMIVNGRIEYSAKFKKLIADTLGIRPEDINEATLRELFFGGKDKKHISASGLLARLKFYLPFILARKTILGEGIGYILENGAIFTKNFSYAKIKPYVQGLVKLSINGSLKNFKGVLKMAAILALQSKDKAAQADARRLLLDLRTKDDKWWKKNPPQLSGRLAENFVYVYTTLFELRALQKRRLLSSKVDYNNSKVFDNYMKRSLFTRFVATGGVDLKLSKEFKTIDPTKFKFDYSSSFKPAAGPKDTPPGVRPPVHKVVTPPKRRIGQITPPVTTDNPLNPSPRPLSFVA
jgi:hypothetical protein